MEQSQDVKMRLEADPDRKQQSLGGIDGYLIRAVEQPPQPAWTVGAPLVGSEDAVWQFRGSLCGVVGCAREYKRQEQIRAGK
jgi:hypothetical protein